MSERASKHRRVQELFLEACELAGESRAAFLDTSCRGDRDLRAELESLLAEDAARPAQFLAPPHAPLAPTPAAELPLPDRIGRYLVRARIGAGGMGVVYEAEQEHPHRTVALKVLRSGALDERSLKRFEVEGEILGRLEHAGIARIYEAGTVDGENERCPYLAMELVRGAPLTRWADERALDVVQRLELFARVCDAVQHAHRSGVIHRDLKPANVLVDDTGQPKVLDFGIALAQDQDARLTLQSTGASQLLGTLQYMSPEQAGGARQIDARADVYALGVVLSELLAGRPPYDLSGCSLPEALRRIAEVEPPLLGASDPRLRGDVELIVAKALAKEPDRRYGGAAELAADLRRTLRHQPVEARAPSRVYLLRKFARRNRVLVGGALSTVVALSIGVVAFAVQARRARDAEGHARAGWSAAEERADELLQLSAQVDLRELVERSRKLWPSVPARAAEFRAWLAEANALLARLPGFERTLSQLEARGVRGEDGALAFASTGDRWWHELLAGLVRDLRAFADPATGLVGGFDPVLGLGVARRLEFANEVEKLSLSGAEPAARWAEATAAIADPARSPAYAGLALAPQLGLVPIGPDPESGLWEFAHVQSGSVPVRGADGRLAFDGESAIVLVLLPGGTFWMGAQSTDPLAPGFDPLGTSEERPVHEERVAPFFLGKHELTQGQWLRFAGANPSRYTVDYWPFPDETPTLAHPVELVDWDECRYALDALGLRLPSEAEWEFGARAGTTTPWWSGAKGEDLIGVANLSGAEVVRAGSPWNAPRDALDNDDARVLHAPVDSLRPNPFGLHHVHGNVWEWTADPAGSYATSIAERETYREGGIHRIMRGGSYLYGVRESRCASRWNFPPDTRRGNIGVRAARSLDP